MYMKTNAELYLPPECVCLNALPTVFLCTSPDAGAIENIEYDDWVVSGAGAEI